MGKQKNRGKRDRMIGVWCDEKEYRFIEKSAEASGISKANYCRKVVLGERSQDSTLGKNGMLKVDVQDIKKELLSVGNNLNQIAKKINTFEQPPNQEILDKIHHDYERVYTKILKQLV
jgi:hypothetical protein